MNRNLLLASLIVANGSFAQNNIHEHSSTPESQMHTRQPQAGYAGMQHREIKAFSEQQLNDLRDGKGMSYALPAELNGFPGPSHILELAVPLGLSDEQRMRTQNLLAKMKTEAKALGEELVGKERELDSLFREKTATIESVRAATQSAALANGRLRASHLQYHLDMMDVLTPAQGAKYAELRGYM